MPRNRKKLISYICTAREDLSYANKIYQKLKEEGWIRPWLYTEDGLGGEHWERAINDAITQAHVFVLCLSKEALSRSGYFQKEIRDILARQPYHPSGTIGIIPLKVSECNLPDDLKHLQWLEFFELEKAYEKLLQSLKHRAKFEEVKITKPSLIRKPEPKRLVELTLDEEILNFDLKRQNTITFVLSKLLNVDEQSIVIKSFTNGSVKIVLEMPESVYVRLDSLVKNNESYLHRLFNVKSCNIFEETRIPLSLVDTFEVITTFIEGAYGNFVGREDELGAFQGILKKPYGKIRIPFILGGGGIGKTRLVRRMLGEAQHAGMLAPSEPIDLFVTEYCHIDGIQWKIKENIENLLGAGQPSPFADFIRGRTDTSEKFYECLKDFCATRPLVLAFDTLEKLDKVTSDWLFKDTVGGLQVPGLICIIAGRDQEIANLDTYRSSPLVKEIRVSGLALADAEEFYRKIDSELDPMGLLPEIAKISRGISQPEGLERIWELTEGHPLKLEMAFRWSPVLREKNFSELTPATYEQELMTWIWDLGERGLLDVTPPQASRAVFDTLMCMAYVTRRFDEDFLQHLIEQQLVRLDDTSMSKREIIDNLQRYFFVKVRSDSNPKILQLHEEMAYLVRSYVWPLLDNSGDREQKLLMVVNEYYDQLLAKSSGEEGDILRVEQLYYTLQRDWKVEGKRLWFELADMGNENMNKLLPGEIKDYLESYDLETRVAFRSRVAEMERNANHRSQALGHWEEVKKLGEAEKREDWVVDALIGQFNVVCVEDPEKAYRKYLIPAKRLAEAKVPDKLARVYYEIGFAYRQMQKIDQAVVWYGKALGEQRKHPEDQARKATILNDRGYAYTYLGRWGFTTRDVDSALRIRQGLLRASRERLKNAKPEEREKLQRSVNEAARRAGMSYNTLGDFGRYAEHPEDALKHYTAALKLFRESDDNFWQAKALCGLGETYRRLALQAKSQDDWANCEDLLQKAEENMQVSLYVCQKFQIDTERDTACRRLGRLFHDRAMIAKEQEQDKKVIRDYLKQAHTYFEQGLEYALKTSDDLEELENRTEMAFLLDDAIEVLGANKVPKEFQNALEELEQALEKHRKDKLRIHPFPVFENLLRLEQAAITFAHGDYPKALNQYLEAYTGLATLPGYGVARYQQHRDHLKTQIQKLSHEDQIEWCQTFIKTWETMPVPGSKPKRYLADDLPDLVEWCYSRLDYLTQAE